MRTRHVVTCFLEREGRVLLLRRSWLVSTYRGQWAGVSGSVETTPLDQAWREVREETGLAPSDLELVASGDPLEVGDGTTLWIVHPFRFRVAGTAGPTLDWEHVEARWVAPDEIARYDAVPGLADAYARVADPGG